MITTNSNPMTRRYGVWAGNPRGWPEAETRCVEAVWPKGEWTDAQCSRKRGHGPDGLFCRQHAKRYEKEAT